MKWFFAKKLQNPQIYERICVFITCLAIFMTKKYLIILIGLLIATTLWSIFVVLSNVAYYSWYKEDVIGVLNVLTEEKEHRENILKKYPEEEITTQALSQMLKQENAKGLWDIRILLPAKKKIAGILTDETTYSITNPAWEKSISGRLLLELVQNQTIIDLRWNPYFLDDTTRNIIEAKINNFLEAKTFLGRLDWFKRYEDFYLSWTKEVRYIHYSLKPIIITNIIYLVILGYTLYWVRKCYKLNRKPKIIARV